MTTVTEETVESTVVDVAERAVATSRERASAEELLAELAETDDAQRRDRLRDRLIRMHLPVARGVARRYRNRGEPHEDLEQAALVGLVNATNRYQPGLGQSFMAYAMPMMTGEVKRHFRDRTWAVRVPRRYQERRAELRAAVGRLTQELGRSPTVDELAEAMQIDAEEVVLTMDASASYSAISLDAPVGDGEEPMPLGETLPDWDADLSSVVDKTALRPALDGLPDRERRILLLRFFGNKTQAEIAGEFGISQMQVSRLLRQTLERLRHELSGE
ncbi:MAG: SigB/SigF/SigG family RNA polymerase sigma factor [Streptosporangiales bacterium]|nr:SigB/SigF/SigG family RNA polymerase sigma factor [Streptosporangiales bacterium]